MLYQLSYSRGTWCYEITSKNRIRNAGTGVPNPGFGGVV